MSSSSETSITISTTSTSESHGQEGDSVIPPTSQVYSAFARSEQIWQDLRQKAALKRLQHDTITLSDLACRLPAIPDDLRGVRDLAGYGTWELRSSGCNAPFESTTKNTRRWILSSQRPTLCTISNQSHFSYSDSASNGIAILFFGWAYILSMSMLERQHIPMRYSTSNAASSREPCCPDRVQLIVDIGHVSEAELAWWTALLAPGQGWRSDNGQDEHPLWAVAYTGSISFRIKGQVRSSTPSYPSPPSSKQAVEFLSRFCRLYNLAGQATLALAMALTLPLHNGTNYLVTLPRPILTRQDAQTCSTIEKEYQSLARYMAFSSNPIFISSAIFGIFWEPGVDCNLVSPWNDPIINVVKPLIEQGELETLGHLMALRRPKVAFLWYAIAACGRTKTMLSIVPFLQNLYAPISSRPIPEIAVWTDSPQSFMDLGMSAPYLQEGGQVLRADVWRLRHECWNIEPEGVAFRNPPMCPWPPFGSINVAELELHVRQHVNCERHQWTYSRWTWDLGNGAVFSETFSLPGSFLLTKDESPVVLSHGSLPDIVYKCDHVASERAVGDIFRWVATEMEPTGKEIYQHPWVEALVDLNMSGHVKIDSSQDSQPNFSCSAAQQINNWITDIEFT